MMMRKEQNLLMQTSYRNINTGVYFDWQKYLFIFFLPKKLFSTTTPLKCHNQWSLLNFVASNWKALNTKSESRFSDLQGKVVDCNCFVEENLLLTFSLWLSLIFPICQFYVWCTTFCILLSVWEPSASRLSLFKRGEPQFALVHCVDQSNNHQ